MATSTLIAISQTDPLQLQGRRDKDALGRLVRHLHGFLGGTRRATSIDIFADGASLTHANAGLLLSGASGSVGGTINGVTITVAAAGGDTATATALANAINANTNLLVQFHVMAQAAGNAVNVVAVHPGIVGNCITLAATGTGVTATSPRLVGGTGGNVSSTTITL